MGVLLAVVEGFFENDDWKLVDAGDGHTWATSVEGDNGAWTAVVQVFEVQGVFAFYALVPVEVTDERAGATVEFLTRANAGMVTGNFEFDYRTRAVRYKTAIDVSALSDEQIRAAGILDQLVHDLVYSNVTTTDRYLPGFERVAAGGDPGTAIAEIERSTTVVTDAT